MDRLELKPVEGASDYFALLFGGERGTDVTRYLRERIRFLGKDVGEDSTDPEEASTYAYNYGPSWLQWIYKREVLKESGAHILESLEASGY